LEEPGFTLTLIRTPKGYKPTQGPVSLQDFSSKLAYTFPINPYGGTLSHNPIFNQAVRTGIAASEMTPVEVDQEFGRLTGKRMTMEGTTSKVIGMLLAVLIGAGVTWFFGLYGFVLPAMLVGLGLGLWASFSKTVRPGVMMAYAELCRLQ